jgi:hypothetical protein
MRPYLFPIFPKEHGILKGISESNENSTGPGTRPAFECITQVSVHLRPTHTSFMATNTNTNGETGETSPEVEHLGYKELMPVLLLPQDSTFWPVKHSTGRLGASHLHDTVMFRLLPRGSTVHAKNVGPDTQGELKVPVHV